MARMLAVAKTDFVKRKCNLSTSYNHRQWFCSSAFRNWRNFRTTAWQRCRRHRWSLEWRIRCYPDETKLHRSRTSI